jgi:hypothetical protein
MALQLNFEASFPSSLPGVDYERIGPAQVSVEAGVEAIRRAKVLSAVEWWTLDKGDDDVVPWFWYIVCTHATNGVDLGFGSTPVMYLEAGGPPAIWTGSEIPTVRGHGGESKILYVLITKTS